MKVIMVGIGRMGGIVARSLAPAVDLAFVGRDPAKVAAAAEEFGARVATDFTGADAVILALPTEATAEVLKEIAPSIPPEAIIINIATAVMRGSLSPFVAEERLAGAKFVAHYYDLAAGGKALIVVDAGSPRAAAVTKEIFRHCGPVVDGREEWVLTTNRAATEEAVRLAIRMRKRMEMAGIPPELIHQATTGVAVGSLRAFMDGRLGPFGQAVADRVLVELEKGGL